MSAISSLFAMETLPSTLAVSALAVYVLGRYKDNVCGMNETCNGVLSKSNTIAIVSAVGAVLLFLLIGFGILQTQGSMYSGSYGSYGMF